MQNRLYSTQEVADFAGVHRDTLLRWLRERVITEPQRDGRGWRVFSHNEAISVATFARSRQATLTSEDHAVNEARVERLNHIEWDFSSAKTSYLTHGLHPYPAKFIPQIPNALIQELSSVGDTIADIFCGSGTTLLEALQLKRNAIGIDANPLATLISEAKTTPLSAEQLNALRTHHAECVRLMREIKSEGALFGDSAPFKSDGWRPAPETCEFWFSAQVVEELAELKKLIDRVGGPAAKRLCEVSLSAIIVNVSKQDSDTRYVRREKPIGPGDTFRRYMSQLKSAMESIHELGDLLEDRFHCKTYNENILNTPATEPFDLVVTSPPYPNAYSYHLYHRTRMLWLGYDPEVFKKSEIGSHRKYSSKGRNRATADTFKAEFETIFQWLRTRLRDRKYACFVIGDSILDGKLIDNATLLAEAGLTAGFKEIARLDRTIQASRKSFNPKIGKIKTEKILVLQKV